MPLAIAPQPVMMPANHVTNPVQADFDSKAKELQEAHTKEMDKIRAEIVNIETKQNEKIGTLTADLSMRSNKDEVDALNQRIEALSKKLPPSQTSILENVKKSLTELIEPVERADSGDHHKNQPSRTDNQVISGGEGGDSQKVQNEDNEYVAELQDDSIAQNQSEIVNTTPNQPQSDKKRKKPKKPKDKMGIWGLLTANNKTAET